MTRTLSQFTTWKNMEEDIKKIWHECEACKQLQDSKSEGQLRMDNIPLTSLEPKDVLHVDLFNFQQKDYVAIWDQV